LGIDQQFLLKFCPDPQQLSQQHSFEQCRFRLPVEVERAGSNICLAGDILHGDTLISPAEEQRRGSVEDMLGARATICSTAQFGI
jgi:hypothetical protein